MLKIAFVHDWSNDLEQMITWNDGLAGALRELKLRGHDIDFYGMADRMKEGDITLANGITAHVLPNEESIKSRLETGDHDAVLFWGDMTRGVAAKTVKTKPWALCFAGGDPLGQNADKFDLIFTESRSYHDRLTAAGFKTQTAFGTNTVLFDPERFALKGQRKVIDVLFPATFAQWKRHSLLVQSLQHRGLTVVVPGFKYESHETNCWGECHDAGFLVLPHVSALALSDLYAASRCVVVPAQSNGGSQRTVLEALAMNIPVIAMKDSEKTSEYLIDGGLGSVVEPEPEAIWAAVVEQIKREADGKARDYILNKWSERHYADSLESGLKSIL